MWNVVGASVIGTSHVSSGAPCQDFSEHRTVVADGVTYVLLAVADGAGSAAHSDEGSKAAVEAALGALEELVCEGHELTEAAALYVLDRAQTRVANLASERNLREREFATTLLFAVISDKDNMFAQVGDGAWAVKCCGQYLAATWPHRGEFANETFFIRSSNWRDGFQFYKHALRIEAVAGFTDGIQMVALRYADEAVHAPFLAPLVDATSGSADAALLKKPLEQFLNAESLNQRTDDDKTLILAARRRVHLLGWPTRTKAESPS